MAKYFNIGNTDFASVRKDEYVDKSQLIAYVNHVLCTQRNDHSAEGAIRQIKEKQYIDALSDYVGEVMLVGINYDKKTKHHECIIERLDASIVQNDTQGAQNDTQGDTQGKLKGKALDAWILAQIRKNPKVSTERLAQLSGRGIATIKRHTAAMPNIRFQGSGYSGVWIIIEQ